ncbi:MAG: endonuclease III [Lachnospiraceae bacterium]|nr:endonuclease III [Lachnospiraceae bacterium]
MAASKYIMSILDRIDEEYGTDDKSYLEYREPWQLLVSTIMSAQCTDARVNAVAKELYRKYPDIRSLAGADLSELERDIHSVGFYHTKAEHIIGCAGMLLERYGGEVPKEIEELTSLPGVGRKTANVVRTHVFHEPSVVVDTHVKRVSNRLGFTKEQDPVRIEFDLMKKVPKDHWSLINLQFIRLGRELCHARRADCAHCFLAQLCRKRGITSKPQA